MKKVLQNLMRNWIFWICKKPNFMAPFAASWRLESNSTPCNNLTPTLENFFLWEAHHKTSKYKLKSYGVILKLFSVFFKKWLLARENAKIRKNTRPMVEIGFPSMLGKLWWKKINKESPSIITKYISALKSK